MIKKLAVLGIATIGGLGLIGMGAGTAFASNPAPGTAATAVCTSATSQLASQAPALASAGAVASNASGIAATNLAAVGTSETAYVGAAMAVVNDADTSGTLPQQVTADTITFNNSVTAFVNAVVASSAANVTSFNATNALNQLTLQSSVLNNFKNATCS